MIRTLGGIVAGLAAAITLIMVTEAIGNQIAPAPGWVKTGDLSETAPLPPMTLLFPVLGWFLGALIGAFVSIKVSDRPWTAWAIAGAVLAAAVFNFVLMFYPLWLMAVGVILPPLGAWLAQKICAQVSERASE